VENTVFSSNLRLEAEVGIEPTLLSKPLIYNKLGISASLMTFLPSVTLPVLLPEYGMQVRSDRGAGNVWIKPVTVQWQFRFGLIRLRSFLAVHGEI